jgi:hypothetical protein
MPYRFVTDFLDFMKCLLNHLSLHSLSLHRDLPLISAGDLSSILPVGDCLGPKSSVFSLKDAVALSVFTVQNLVILLETSNLHTALYCVPIVLWRVANQSVNIKREARFQLLGAAFAVVRIFDDLYERCGSVGQSSVGELRFFYRQEDIQIMLVSLAVVGFILPKPLTEINLWRIGTCSLEHLFGVT